MCLNIFCEFYVYIRLGRALHERRRMFWFAVLVFVSVQTPDLADSYSCKSLSGSDVDWFYAYKLPTLEKDSKQGANKGTAFLYADSRTNAWVLSEEGIDSPRSAIGLTVKQLFNVPKSHFFALYNDQHPNDKTDSYRGHMKGILLFNDFNGIWVIHSIPKYPSITSGSYTYPDSGKRNGQSFLCITFPTTHLDEIGKQLVFGQPSIYAKQLPPSYERLYPNLAQAINEKAPSKKLLRTSGSDYSSVAPLVSVGGQRFVSFSKNKKFAKDLYSDLVAPQLRTSFYVETWLNGGGDLTSECDSSFKVYNLRSVRPSAFSFENSNDHSKWAVSTETSSPWICVGDINRQKSQEGRGGGTMCLSDARISALYRLSVGKIECCATGARVPRSVWGSLGNFFGSGNRGESQKLQSVRKKPGVSETDTSVCVPPPKTKPRRRRTTKKSMSKKFMQFIKARTKILYRDF